MGLKILKSCSFLILPFLAALSIPRAAFAETFDLSYTLTEGGFRLELTPANANKGVNMQVTSDAGVRYEIIQKIDKPLENKERPEEQIRDNFVLRAIRGTNRLGTLHVPSIDSPARTDEVLYTSDTAGTQDSFTLIYGLLNAETIEPGYYFGRISFTLKPIDSTRTQVTKFLDIYVTISEEAGAKPSIEISTLTGVKTIGLNPKNEEKQKADIAVKINGKFRNLFNITQALLRPLESNEGNRLDSSLVNFSVSETKKGTGLPQATALSGEQQPQVIYTSGAGGSADESFVITYGLGDFSKQKAGRHRSHLQYALEEAGKAKVILDTLELEIENERLFELVVNPQEGMGSIQFPGLKPKEPPKKSEVTLEIRTNLRQQYQVSQNVLMDLTSKEGRVIPERYFTVTTQSLDSKGTLKLPQKTEVRKGETILFVSDKEGSGDKFKLIYELAFPQDAIAGDYSTRITYSLSEI